MSDPWIAVLVALAGGVGGFAGSALSVWVSNRSQDTTHRREQQRRDAEALGPVSSYLTDSDPQRLAFNMSPDTEVQSERMQKLVSARDRLRIGLLVLAAGHPAPAAADLARQLDTALYNALTSARWAVSDLHSAKDLGYLDQAIADHARAQSLLSELNQASARYGRKAKGASS